MHNLNILVYVLCISTIGILGIDTINNFKKDFVNQGTEKTETLLKSEKINYDIIHNLNVRSFARNIQELEKWEKIKLSSYDIQYRVDQINSLKKELDNFVKLFDEREGYKHTNYRIMELIKDHPKYSDNMRSWLRNKDEFLITYDEFRKQNR